MKIIYYSEWEKSAAHGGAQRRYVILYDREGDLKGWRPFAVADQVKDRKGYSDYYHKVSYSTLIQSKNEFNRRKQR